MVVSIFGCSVLAEMIEHVADVLKKPLFFWINPALDEQDIAQQQRRRDSQVLQIPLSGLTIISAQIDKKLRTTIKHV